MAAAVCSRAAAERGLLHCLLLRAMVVPKAVGVTSLLCILHALQPERKGSQAACKGARTVKQSSHQQGVSRSKRQSSVHMNRRQSGNPVLAAGQAERVLQYYGKDRCTNTSLHMVLHEQCNTARQAPQAMNTGVLGPGGTFSPPAGIGSATLPSAVRVVRIVRVSSIVL